MTDVEQVCCDATAATHDFYREHHAALRNRGYAVMYGPPLATPPVLLIGYQPGGRQISDIHLDLAPEPSPWPEALEYATDTYPLARRLQEVFGAALLRECTGVNALFFKSPDVVTYREEVPLILRREAARLCLPWVQRIVRATAPRLVVAIGLDTLKLFGPTRVVEQNAAGRALVTAGEIGGRPALGVLHLSGAQIATADRVTITAALRTAAGVS